MNGDETILTHQFEDLEEHIKCARSKEEWGGGAGLLYVFFKFYNSM